MAEAETSTTERKLPRAIRMMLVGSLTCAFLFSAAYFWIERPIYTKIDLPDDGDYSNWHFERHTVYTTRGGVGGLQRHFIWQMNGSFKTSQSSDAVATVLNEWIIDQGWQPESRLEGFGQTNFNPCQSSIHQATIEHCFYYTGPSLGSEPYSLDVFCGTELAALYVIRTSDDFYPIMANVSTIKASPLSALTCVLSMGL